MLVSFYFTQYYYTCIHRCYGTKCAGCNTGLCPEDLVRRAVNKVYHVQCFVCSACKKELSAGEQLFLIQVAFWRMYVSCVCTCMLKICTTVSTKVNTQESKQSSFSAAITAQTGRRLILEYCISSKNLAQITYK